MTKARDLADIVSNLSNNVPCTARQMKFVLMLSVCSFVTGECKPPITYAQTFDTWKQCATVAMNTSMQYLQAMDDETVNKFQLSTQYTCTQQEII